VGGQSISLIGSWTETIAQALLVLKLTDSAFILGLVMATRYVPALLGTPYAGLIVDRRNKRRAIMPGSAGGQAAGVHLGYRLLGIPLCVPAICLKIQQTDLRPHVLRTEETGPISSCLSSAAHRGSLVN
jgi:hypothetical protein